jgi:hypothetical protein
VRPKTTADDGSLSATGVSVAGSYGRWRDGGGDDVRRGGAVAVGGTTVAVASTAATTAVGSTDSAAVSNRPTESTRITRTES